MKKTRRDMNLEVRAHLTASAKVQERAAQKCARAIQEAAHLLCETFRAGGKVLLCGNGGSAADCQHLAAEFVGRLSKKFERPGLPALALTTDTSLLTAVANDKGFEEAFARQVRVLGKAGDVLVAISTSGNSKNVLRAARAARKAGMKTVALQGQGGSLAYLADVSVVIPSRDTQYIQEVMLSVEHVLCHLVESALFAPRKT